jgi:hypothetical protein
MTDRRDTLRPLGASARRVWHVNEAEVVLAQTPAAPRILACRATPQGIRIDLARTAIVVVDMQNDFCHADGWLASIGVDVAPARTPIAPLTALLPRLRAQPQPVPVPRL